MFDENTVPALATQFKDHTLQNVVDDLELGELPKSAISVHLQPIRNIKLTIQIIDIKTNQVVDTIIGKADSGSVKMDSNSLIRRTCTFSMRPDESLMPNSNSLLWFGNYAKIYMAIQDMSKRNEEVNFLLGTYYVDELGLNISSDGSELDVEMSDKMGQFETAKFENKLKLEVGTPIGEAIRLLMEHVGETNFGYIHESAEEEYLPYTIEEGAGTEVMDVVEKLRDMYMDYTCGYNLQGAFEFRKLEIQKEDEVNESKWRFDSTESDRSDLTLSFNESYPLKDVKNRIVVIGATNDKTGIGAKGEVRLTDPKSPFNIYAIGERTEVLTEDKYATNEQCIAMARYEIWKRATFQEKCKIQSVPLYIIDSNDVIDVIHPLTKKVVRYKVDSFEYGLGVDATMTIEASKLYFTSLEYGEERLPLIEDIVRGISNWGWLSLAEERLRDCYNIEAAGNATITVRFFEGALGGGQASITSYPTTKNQTLMIDLADMDGLDNQDENGYIKGRSKGDYLDRVLAHEWFHAVSNDYVGHHIMAETPPWFQEGFAEFIHGCKERFESVYTDKTQAGKKEELLKKCTDILNGNWSGSSEEYVASYLCAVACYRLSSQSHWRNFFVRLKQQENVSLNFLLKILPIGSTNDEVKTKVLNEISNMDEIWNRLFDRGETDTMSVGGRYFMNLYGVSLNAEDVFNNANATTISTGFQIKFEK